MDTARQQQLTNEINEIGDRLQKIYQQLRGTSDFKFGALIYPKVASDGEIKMKNMVNTWVVESMQEVHRRDAEAARRREEQSEIRRQQEAEKIKEAERDRIQYKINLIEREIIELDATILRYQGLGTELLDKRIEEKQLEISNLKSQMESI